MHTYHHVESSDKATSKPTRSIPSHLARYSRRYDDLMAVASSSTQHPDSNQTQYLEQTEQLAPAQPSQTRLLRPPLPLYARQHLTIIDSTFPNSRLPVPIEFQPIYPQISPAENGNKEAYQVDTAGAEHAKPSDLEVANPKASRTPIWEIIGAFVIFAILFLSGGTTAAVLNEGTSSGSYGSSQDRSQTIVGHIATTVHTAPPIALSGKNASYYLYTFQLNRKNTKDLTWACNKIDTQPPLTVDGSPISTKQFSLQKPAVPDSPLAVVGHPEQGTQKVELDLFYLSLSACNQTRITYVRFICDSSEEDNCSSSDGVFSLPDSPESHQIDIRNPSLTASASLDDPDTPLGAHDISLSFRGLNNTIVKFTVRAAQNPLQKLEILSDPTAVLKLTSLQPASDPKEYPLTYSTAASFLDFPHQQQFVFYRHGTGIDTGWWNTSGAVTREPRFSLLWADPLLGRTVTQLSGFDPSTYFNSGTATGIIEATKITFDGTPSGSRPFTDAGRGSISVACYGAGNAVLVYSSRGTLKYAIRLGTHWTSL
ncbi:hypothetical protein QBC44DRAFT_313702 [Cladorrhinum sp. PSN332]|nr:hypothetical protein QBC44DRAFT_313702 [Cladorrhinum sp. PSN332]